MKWKNVVIITVVASCVWTVAGVLSAQATQPNTNGRIAFQIDFGIGAEIYTIKPSGRGIHQLTEVDGSA